MPKNHIAILVGLSSLFFLTSWGVRAITLNMPTQWTYGSKAGNNSQYIYPAVGSPTVPFGVPDNIASRRMYNWPGYANNSSIYTADVAHYEYPHMYGSMGLHRDNTVATAWINGEAFNAVISPVIPPTCLRWGVASLTPNGGGGYDRQMIFTAGCFPITMIDPNACTITSNNVSLDHGTIILGSPSRATGLLEISCKKAGSGRLVLPTGASSVPIGGGSAVLSTGRGPLSTALSFPAGSSTIQLVSTLSNVTSGVWAASTVITLDMD